MDERAYSIGGLSDVAMGAGADAAVMMAAHLFEMTQIFFGFLRLCFREHVRELDLASLSESRE